MATRVEATASRPRHRRVCRAAAFFSLAAATASPALADEVSGLRSELLTERSHDITLTMHADHAELVVRRTVWNGAEKSDQATFFIDVPTEAVATGLRTLGSLDGRPHWFRGELMEAEAAAAKYRELTGIGGYYPKDPALLSWRSQGLLALQVFPCLGRQSKTIEYTLALPTTYRDGAFHVEVPAFGTEKLGANIVVRSGDSRAKLLVSGAPPPPAVRPEHDTPLDVSLVPRSLPTLGGELVATEFAHERVLTRYAVQAAPRLSEVPRNARIVVAIDASLSTDSWFVDNAKAALDAYLSHFVDAEVDLVLFSRKIERPFGKFVSVAEGRRRLETLEVRRRNGSDIDRALWEADQSLAKQDASRPRRIVLVTDGRGRQGLTAERMRAATSTSGAAVHVGILENGTPDLRRDDDHPWARGLKPNHGLVWHAANDGEQSEMARRVFEEWARPVRLHGFRLSSPNLSFVQTLEQHPPELDEGQGVEALLVESSVVPFIHAEGGLWTRPVSANLRRDPGRDKLWSALVFGSDLLHELSEPEMMTLAMKGGAVSPVTSYLAIEPGVRPSTEGIDWGISGQGFGAGGGGLGGGSTWVSGAYPALDREAFLRDAIAKDWRRCGGRPGTVAVSFETTVAEIVHIASIDVQGGDALLERCLREAVWDLVLPVSFSEQWENWSISV
jgi:hypothetical protein